MSLAPIVVFTYNRPWHIQQTIEALMKNVLAKDSELFIFSDGPKDERDRKKVEEVRHYLRKITGFKKITIIERRMNLDLANSIIAGVTEIVNKYGKIIVLEDDLLTSPYFLKFMNEGLSSYEKEKKVASIQGYIYPVKGKLPETFFLRHSGCYGWATWKNRWDLFVNDGKLLLEKLLTKKLTKIFDHNNSYPYTRLLENQAEGNANSWAIRWYASTFLSNKLTLYPGKSLVSHIGNDDSGTHRFYSHNVDTDISSHPIHIKKIKVKESVIAFKEFFKYYKSTYASFPFKVIKRIVNYIHKLR